MERAVCWASRFLLKAEERTTIMWEEADARREVSCPKSKRLRLQAHPYLITLVYFL